HPSSALYDPPATPHPHSFPTRRSSDLAPGVLRTSTLPAGYALIDGDTATLIDAPRTAEGLANHGIRKIDSVLLTHHHRDSSAAADRKSTRLNSSHRTISYAVFCLKKKT